MANISSTVPLSAFFFQVKILSAFLWGGRVIANKGTHKPQRWRKLKVRNSIVSGEIGQSQREEHREAQGSYEKLSAMLRSLALTPRDRAL